MGPKTVKELMTHVNDSIQNNWTLDKLTRRAILTALRDYLDLLARINGDWEKVNKSKAG